MISTYSAPLLFCSFDKVGTAWLLLRPFCNADLLERSKTHRPQLQRYNREALYYLNKVSNISSNIYILTKTESLNTLNMKTNLLKKYSK